MPERARTDLWEPQGSNPLGPPGRNCLQHCRHFATDAIGAGAYHPRSTPEGDATRRGSKPPDKGAAIGTESRPDWRAGLLVCLRA